MVLTLSRNPARRLRRRERWDELPRWPPDVTYFPGSSSSAPLPPLRTLSVFSSKRPSPILVSLSATRLKPRFGLARVTSWPSGLSPNNRHPIPPAIVCCQFYLVEFVVLECLVPRKTRFGSSLPTLGIDGEIHSSIPRDEYLLTMGS